jgi:hypothetical protein
MPTVNRRSVIAHFQAKPQGGGALGGKDSQVKCNRGNGPRGEKYVIPRNCRLPSLTELLRIDAEEEEKAAARQQKNGIETAGLPSLPCESGGKM